jgi:hypothetical protein
MAAEPDAAVSLLSVDEREAYGWYLPVSGVRVIGVC